MRRPIAALAILALGLLAALPHAGAQPARRLPRIGVIAVGPPPGAPGAPSIPPFAAFVSALADLGHVDGQTVVLDWGPAGLTRAGMAALAADLVRRQADVVVALGPAPIREGVHRVTGPTPLVFVAGTEDPVRGGLVQSLARPGGPATGITWTASTELEHKLLEVVKEAIPRLLRVGRLSDQTPGSADTLPDEWEAALRTLGLTLLERVVVTGPEALDEAFATLARQGPDAIFVPMVTHTYTERRRVAALARRHRLPTFAVVRELPEAGGLLSYGPDLLEIYRRGAWYVDRILKGVKPAELPVEQPSRYALVVNVRTARTLGVTLPPSLLQRADERLD